MDAAAFATILSAGISAFVVASTFLTGEVIRLRRDQSERRSAAVSALLTALGEVPVALIGRVNSRLLQALFRGAEVEGRAVLRVVSATTALYGALPKRDHYLVDWIGWRISESTMDAEEIIARCAEATGVLIRYSSDRKDGLAYVRRHNDGFDAWKRDAMQDGEK